MSTSQNPTPDDKPRSPSNDRLSITQVLASMLAAVTSTVALSQLGVAGTVIGAAMAAVITVVGNFLYARWLQRGRQTVKVVTEVARDLTATKTLTNPATDSESRQPINNSDPTFPNPKQRPMALSLPDAPENRGPDELHNEQTSGVDRWWTRLAKRYGTKKVIIASIAIVFLLIMTIVTVFELAVGRSLSDITQGKEGESTSISELFNNHERPKPTQPVPEPRPSTDPAPSQEPTHTEAPSMAPAPEPTRAPIPSAVPEPTVQPTPDPTPVPTSQPTPVPTPDEGALGTVSGLPKTPGHPQSP